MPKLKIHISTDTRREGMPDVALRVERGGNMAHAFGLLILLGHTKIVTMANGNPLFLRRN